MKSAITSCAILTLALFFGAWQAQAATITVGPTGQYASPCLAFPHMADGDTLLVDANNGTPYLTDGCSETANYATITGVNGRPIINPGTGTVYNALWQVYGHDVVIDNFEFRNTGSPTVSAGDNAPGIWVKAGKTATPGGANLTVEQSYFYNNKMGLLTDNVGFAGYTAYAWYSANPYITLQYDEFAASAGEANDLSHNIYISGGGNMTLNMQYSFSHDNQGGHELKSRALYSNVYYNFIADLQGVSDFVLDFPLGGHTYVVGNVIYKANVLSTPACGGPCTNGAFIVYRSRTDNQVSGSYPEPDNDFHFVNNTAIDGESNVDPGRLLALVNLACYDDGLTTEECPAPATVSGGLPGNGGALTTPAVFENNIFVGATSSLGITNQTSAVLKGNILLDNNSTNLADLFVDPADLDFHLISGSPAIGAGVYPPTDNQGTADPLALAADEYVHPVSGVARPTPSGSTMDAGAYSYPRVDTPPTLNLSYSNTISAPNSGTITVSGMPAPPTGQFNHVVFASQNESVIPYIETAETTTGSVTVTYLTNPVAATVTVPIDIYANGAHAIATVTVNPGPPTLYSVTRAGSIYIATDQVNLEGPAPAGGLVVNLSSSDPSFLYTPATVTVPAGQISASVGTLAANFFTPSPQTETLTATAGSVIKTLTRAVYSPKFTGADCGSCTVVGGQPGEIYSDISYGPAPENGAGVTISSNNTAVIPNQTVPVAPGQLDFPHSSFNVTTNAVSTTTTVTITANFGPYSSGTATFTVNPGGATPASIAVVSGSGQTANVGSNFPNPLTVMVEDASSNPVSGATVTFAGTGVSFPNGATAVTGSNGQASVVAQPSQSGSLTVTASVSGVSSPATFSETGTAAGGTLASITNLIPQNYDPVTLVNLTGPATAPVVVQLSSSDPTVVYVPATVTIPTGASSARTGSLLGSLWGQSPSTKTATLSATYNGVTVILTRSFATVGFNSFGCQNSCTVTGGQPLTFIGGLIGLVPYGGATLQITSNNPAVIPNQSFPLAQGANTVSVPVVTNAVSTTTTVQVTANYNGSTQLLTITVNSSTGAPASIAVVSGSGQTANVGTSFPNPLTVMVEDASSHPVQGATVTFAGTGVSFPNGATAVTGSNGQASVVAQPSQSGSLTVTASVSGVSSPATFSETGTAAGGTLASITNLIPQNYDPVTLVNLTGPATAPVVVQLSSSDPTVVYVPATVTIPTGASSARTGSLLGSLWGQSPSTKTATLSATYNGVTVILTRSFATVGFNSFGCQNSCTVTGGQPLTFIGGLIGLVPYGGATLQITSNNPAVIPNQSFPLAQGANTVSVPVVTNAVSTTTTVQVTANYNGSARNITITVNP